MFRFSNTYINLPNCFYQKVLPKKLIKPKLIQINKDLIETFGLNDLSHNQLSAYFSGQKIPMGASPISTAYAGHQFGHFVPSLGDGRAILLGEILDKNDDRFDIQLKGSGLTKFSRNGDGKSPLGPAMREYLISEAMYYLKIPTTRTIALLKTGEDVFREKIYPGGISVRIAQSHIRIGNFEYFMAKKDFKNLRILANYSINRHYPELIKKKNNIVSFFYKVMINQIKLVVKWLSVGFIHGVMNTDNTTISGETIDYGPCAFMDNFEHDKVFSSIDEFGRYSYNNQSFILKWNLSCFASCLIPLIDDNKKLSIKLLETELEKFDEIFNNEWLKTMSLKLGISNPNKSFIKTVQKWLKILELNKLDFTNSFIILEETLSSNSVKRFPYLKDFDFFMELKKCWLDCGLEKDEILKTMQKANPKYIPRNHLVEECIKDANTGQYESFKKLNSVLKKPYTKLVKETRYSRPPQENQKIQQTFCGT